MVTHNKVNAEGNVKERGKVGGACDSCCTMRHTQSAANASRRMLTPKVTFSRGLVAIAVTKFSGCSFQELKAMPAAVLQRA